jgi:4-hydroxybenzoyl-CoA thioesterase
MRPFFQRAVRIEWSQCDPTGVVHSPRYFDMFGESTILMLEAAGLPPKRDMITQLNIAGFPMIDVAARFLRPVRYGDTVVIETATPVFGNTSFTVSHRLMLGRTVCVECTEKRVWTVKDGRRPGGIRTERVPEQVRALFGRKS